MFTKDLSAMNIVILGEVKGEIKPLYRFRLHNNNQEILHTFPCAVSPDKKHFAPVIGPRVYRELTKRELKGTGRTYGLIPLCNTGEKPMLEA